MLVFTWLKLSPHHHTGRLRPHEHTSYAALAFIVLVVGLVLAGFSISTSAVASPGPESGSIGLGGTMPQAAPKTAATVSEPSDKQHFTTSPITVSGTCPDGTLVEIYKNDIFAGSTECDDHGNYSVKIDLLIGQNILLARVYDVLNQAGPDSNTATVFYDVVPPQFASLNFTNFSDRQLLLSTDAVYRGIFPNQILNVPISIIGGTPPFAINVEWGDSTNKVVSRSDNLSFNAGHTYHKPGTYDISIQATDSQQHIAFLQVAAIVNGPPAVIASTNAAAKTPTNQLLVLWPLYAIVTTIVASFWLGEQREKRLIRAHATIPTFTQ